MQCHCSIPHPEDPGELSNNSQECAMIVLRINLYSFPKQFEYSPEKSGPEPEISGDPVVTLYRIGRRIGGRFHNW